MDPKTLSPLSRVRKSSRNVTLVLLGAAALTSCGAGSRNDNSWGDAPGTSNASRSSSYYGSHYYGGYGNSYLSSPRSTSPSTTSPSKDGVTRGGFGSKSSFHSSGS